MRTYPLHSINLEEAKKLQFKIIDTITKHFDGREILSLGDLGVVKGLNKPTYTKKVENVFAEVFDAEAAILVRGAGTGAIRWGLISFMKSGDTILVHDAPIYPTSKVTIETMGLNVITANFNDLEDIKNVISKHPEIKGALVQNTRQKIDDSYDLEEVITTIKEGNSNIRIITDDNYAALKVKKIGNQCGADLGSFSCFKILGPEGVGVLIGKKDLIDKVYSLNYSGGSQVQGHEAMEALRGLVYAPVSLAIQSEVNEELVSRLKGGEIPEIKDAFLANAQSKVLLVEFKEEIAEDILELTTKYGAASHPVGSESIYEFVPMMYRVSGTFRAADPTLEKRMIRINPMRSGADTIIRILKSAIEEVREVK
ncbi:MULTISPECIES: aminotransferase class V-fold PLP-dependent enzyme [unclassified Clostridium]|uniref:aminotransferase class V-fold PLP-dependent enzyme n=1 Tax=unclassified Clostridium TaxID=2614128 RepID=UPI0025BF92BE|nr:aminotransferase class V-fold PLP-dependent enzyme [Clostridium sp.]MCI6690984.1 cysteine desulfurase [Clostridium sp.]MDY2632093.1 aminotransferase class V-fold PLP-dependent enzyme [Clostridium sp.]MDY6226507.1 aminotransferase class V-fold PLP-dependent enzyme [Clostridium sp.]